MISNTCATPRYDAQALANTSAPPQVDAQALANTSASHHGHAQVVLNTSASRMYIDLAAHHARNLIGVPTRQTIDARVEMFATSSCHLMKPRDMTAYVMV